MIIALEEHCPAHFGCYDWIHAPLWMILTVFLLFLLLCLITDYHCHLLSSICYCTNDEMNLFKQLNRWQKPQLLQWLSPLISNHFSNPNQRRSLACTFYFFPWKSSNENESQTSKASVFRQAGGRKEGENKKSKRKNTVVRNKRERTRFHILKSKLKGMQMSSHPSPSQVTGMSGPWKPSQYNYTPSFLPPAKEVLLEQERRAIRSLRLMQGNPGESHL